MEIAGLIFGAVSALVGASGIAIKGIACLRSLDNQIAQIRLSQAEGDHSCQAQLAEIRAQLALIQGQLELAKSISSSPRHKRGEPIE